MITKVIMPQLSLTMRYGIVVRWLKNEGDFIQRGEPICSIEGDKASVEIEASTSGYLKKLVAPLNTEFPVKEAIAYIGDANDVVTEEILKSTVIPSNVSNQPKLEKIQPIPKSRILATPVAKRLATELGVDLSKISGSGPDGLINREDVISANDSHSINSAEDHLKVFSQTKLIGIKKTIADRLKKSYQDAPHIHLSVSCEMTEVIHKRDYFNQKKNNQSHLTFTDFIIWAVSRVLSKDRILNSSFNDDTIIVYEDINIGFAAETEKGLIVPVIKRTSTLTINEISQKRQELVDRVKKSNHTIDDLSQGTFTITNLGMFMIDEFDPIINYSQSGILGIGRIIETPVVDSKDKIIARPLMKLTLACDHRVADGVEGARFLTSVKTILENPSDIFNEEKS